MSTPETHHVGIYETTIPTEDYETFKDAALSQLLTVEKNLREDPIAQADFRERTALEVARDRLKKALGK